MPRPVILQRTRLCIWVLLFSFLANLVTAEVVVSDGQPRVKPPAVSGEVVVNDGQPRVKPPAVSGEVVVNDGQPRVKPPAVSSEVVVNDGQPRVKVPGQGPAINPFVGEIAVGISLLITYAPQIIAMATAVATIAAAINTIKGTGKQTLALTESIGSKLQRMLQLLLGPLSLSNGMAKEGVENLSAHLLQVTQSVTRSLNTPVDGVQNQVDQSLAMSRDLQALLTRGQALSQEMKALAAQTSTDLGKVVQGGEIQLLRDGSRQVADRLGRQADLSLGAFNQSLQHTNGTIAALEHLQAEIAKALQASGRSAQDATLQEIGLSGAQLGKQLIEARKGMVFSEKALVAADKSAAGLHTEILALLGEMKTELETYARNNGISPEQLDRQIKALTAAAPRPAAAQAGKTQATEASRLTSEIGFMVENLSRLTDRSRRELEKLQKAEAARSQARAAPAPAPKKADDERYQKMVTAYKTYMSIMTTDPTNQKAIAAARLAFEAAQSEYQKTFEP
ncbi:MAG: hypothetical protein OZSIB_3563 [Candidatus Ozemobacter sibiricus]|uniref:Uncharacterized protein n=1 Tax=Candidatus Ozemobacter sibiricus TaxID=2268124 RepID=A0A367ZQN3_9BACT|nr:MAG: hypothetical protein OZSIB_3563 [Candidatus Ozemobacter sibiricus]